MTELAINCLEIIAQHPDSDHRLLYTCALDAQEIGNRRIALRSLQYILGLAENSSEVAAKVPVILRSTIRLTMTEIENTRDARSHVENLCSLYERGILDFSDVFRWSGKANLSPQR